VVRVRMPDRLSDEARKHYEALRALEEEGGEARSERRHHR
jgi:hypothetical protein